MADGARQQEPEVIETEGELIEETTKPVSEGAKYAEAIDMGEYREMQEEASAAAEAEELELEIAEASSITDDIVEKISKVLENPTIRKYLKKPIALADAICRKSVAKVWNEMPDEIKVGIAMYPSTAIPDLAILSLQAGEKCGFLDMPANWSEKDYAGSDTVLIEQVAKYGKHIMPELEAIDKIVKFAKKVSVAMDNAFYKNIRSMVREIRAEKAIAAANDNADVSSVDDVLDEVSAQSQSAA